MSTPHLVQGRAYNLVSPPSSNVPMPLLLVLHGGLGNAVAIEQTTGFSELVESECMHVAYPQGTSTPAGPNKRTWNAGACCGPAVALKVDDVGFLSALIDDVAAEHPDSIDLSRVWVAGMSNGAMMAYRLAVEAPEKIAAVVVVAGTLAIDNADAAKDVPVLHIHGDSDDNVPWLGGVGEEGMSGVSHKSVPDTMTLLLAPRGQVTSDHWFPLTDVERWCCRCASGGDIELNRIVGGGHEWPGAAGTSSPLDATAMAVAFCKRFQKSPP